MVNPEQPSDNNAEFQQTFYRCFSEYARDWPEEIDRIARESWNALSPDKRDTLHLFVRSITDGTPSAIQAATRTILLSEYLAEQYKLALKLEADYTNPDPLHS